MSILFRLGELFLFLVFSSVGSFPFYALELKTPYVVVKSSYK